MTTAQTILQQLGGNRFIAMTGARSFIGLSNGLMFALPTGSTRNKSNKVRITLDAMDTYTTEFFNIRGSKVKTISTHDSIYCDGLQNLISDQTGLALHF